MPRETFERRVIATVRSYSFTWKQSGALGYIGAAVNDHPTVVELFTFEILAKRGNYVFRSSGNDAEELD